MASVSPTHGPGSSLELNLIPEVSAHLDETDPYSRTTPPEQNQPGSGLEARKADRAYRKRSRGASSGFNSE